VHDAAETDEAYYRAAARRPEDGAADRSFNAPQWCNGRGEVVERRSITAAVAPVAGATTTSRYAAASVATATPTLSAAAAADTAGAATADPATARTAKQRSTACIRCSRQRNKRRFQSVGIAGAGAAGCHGATTAARLSTGSGSLRTISSAAQHAILTAVMYM